MRAAQVTEHGEPRDVVRTVEVSEPDLQEASVLVRVSAGSLNFGDIARCRGGIATVTAQPPFTLGMDVCGHVVAGPEAWLGRRVVGVTAMALGGLAETASVPLAGLFDAPPQLTDVETAAFLLPFHVAQLALVRRARAQAGETVVVVGAATSLGTAFQQLAVARGAKVIAVTTTPDKRALCEELGASVVVDRSVEDLFSVVLDRTDGRGADVVVDLIGGEATEPLWTCIAAEGRYVPVGFNDDPTGGFAGRSLRKVSMGNFDVIGVMLAYGEPNALMKQFGLNLLDREIGRQIHEDLGSLLDAGVRPVIGRTIGLDDVGATLQEHAARRTAGRSVVDLTR